MKCFVASLVVCLVTGLAYASLQAGENGTKKAFVVPEAKQPRGFPNPGEVGAIIVKQYPSYRAARVTSDSMRQNAMFGELFQHIKQNKISMTAPVEMTYPAEGPSSMSFLYSSIEVGETSAAGKVQVVDVPPATVVSIGVRGEYTQDRFEECRSKLMDWLKENNDQWVVAGAPRYLGYNSPFVPDLLKYGEVQVPIRAQDG
jgi:hypothetical protein